MANWLLKCLICGCENTDLVSLQEHIMKQHSISQDSLVNAVKEKIGDTYIWKSHAQYFMLATPIPPPEEPDIDDSAPQWADYYSNYSDYLLHEFPNYLN